MPRCPIAVLGEALVDEFHDGPVAGGAPFNVARSLAALGVPALFISRIGADDANGRLLLQSARRYELAEQGLQRDMAHATGRVSVHERPGGGHSFEIHGDAAWDHLDADPAGAALAEAGPGILYFGSLAQRHPVSRAAIRALAKAFAGVRLLDLNQRPGTDTPLLAAESLMLADWVKVNDEELARLAAWFADPSGTEAAQVAALMDRFALQRLVLTCGPEGWRFYGPGGALLAQGGGAAQPRLVDTVGAGDSFTALLLAGLALRRDLPATLALANRYAAFICGLRGPLPSHPQALASWREALQALPPSPAA
ncbi:PfkB family carbohydrate kinase [Roseateles saccharophilus]|uniref:Fructokinase n=1 Tax=Roseateles saccharophilus TaxID=304 RepID=A0A4R3UTC5_ROSSA|nr:PfkB family carbohydrate kinase [Roseateles saccharophilus]MDG0836147.1 fructokinase [Roseateles saccharophilus]TCU93284.1 fructokinase [Roseateles saccharophilus]